MPRLFDAYIAVDWSAAAKPVTGANSIWIGILARDARLRFQYRGVNVETRLKARAFIEDIIAKLTGRGDKVLLGFDFSFGFPAGTADALGLDTTSRPAWAAMHEHLASKVREREDNSNARFALAAGFNYRISQGPFPFWGAPARDQVNTLAGRRPDFGASAPLAEYREVERHMRTTRAGAPKSVWQLAYAGSVGSQTLLGIPHVHALRNRLPKARIWPFETGLTALDEAALSDTQVLMAEIYPSLVKVEAPREGGALDAAQVEAIARHYCDLDQKSALAPLFGGSDGLDQTKISRIEAEEGWILGA